MERGLKGMCENSTRELIFEPLDNTVIEIPFFHSNRLPSGDVNCKLILTLHHITQPEHYEIFMAMRMNNFSKVIDLIDDQRGINALDEYGQSVLMLAVQRGALPVVASLLNARRPRVDVNLSKGNGFNALFYSIELRDASLLQALLRRGANPNSQLNSEGSRGNTPLHVACLLEQKEHAAALLDYGANPFITNDYGLLPLQMLPKDAVRTKKLGFKRIFDEALKRMQTIIDDGSTLPSGKNVKLEQDL
jgi:ankyrin repeat protein